MSVTETFFCCLTPPSRGAVAVIEVKGNEALPVLERYFRPAVIKRKLGQLRSGETIYGTWSFALQDTHSPTEDVIIVRRDSDCWEIHSHGGSLSIQMISECLSQSNVHGISQTDYLKKNVQNEWLAELHLGLSHCETESTARLFLQQLQIWSTLSSIADNESEEFVNLLSNAIGYWPITRHALDPWRIVLSGKPNVGKSSLINAIMGFERTIVDPTPGTTRDVVRQRTVIDGWPVELSDTAGIREHTDALESAAIEKGMFEALHSDLTLHVLDSNEFNCNARNRPPIHSESKGKQLIVWNKVDCLAAVPNHDELFLSARDGLNIDRLLEAIGATLWGEPLPTNQPLLLTASMHKRAQQVLDQ
ncbi:MAG: GTPase [Pirellulaceae bacterium]